MTDPFVSVMVPQEYVLDVYRFLAIKSSKPTKKSKGKWDKEDLQKVWDDSAKEMKAWLKMIATASAEVPSEELMKCRNATNRQQLAGQLGAFGRRMKHRHAGKKLFDRRWDEAKQEYFYSMNPDIKEFFEKA